MRLSTIPNIGRNANRFREIAQTAAKYGFADWMHSLDSDFMKDWLTSSRGDKISDISREQRIRLALTELGPTYIKLGQTLSTRADLVGPDLANELQLLQANIPPDSADQVRKTIEEELGGTIEDIFTTFDFDPIGSASIGQVHAAQLKTGEEVVVKVQHADVHSVIETDLDILEGLADWAQDHSSELQLYQPRRVIRSFRRSVLQQIDFLREKRNLEQFRRNFAEQEEVYFPEPYEEWCTSKVLTMERLFGRTLREIRDGEESGVRAKLARRGGDAYLEMIFRDGFYHADPHPGNFIIMENNVVGFLDCGLVGRIDSRMRQDFEDMIVDVINEDAQSLVNDILQIGSTPRELDRDLFRADVSEFVNEFGSQNLTEFDLGDALNRLTGLIRQHRIVLPANVSMLLRVLIMLEGTGGYLSPNFSLIELLEPYSSEVAWRRYSPARMAAKFRRRFREFDRLLDNLPADIADIIERMREGQFDVKIDHLRVDTTANRVVHGILTAALFLGSAQLWSSNTPPTIRDVSVFGASGCFLALLLGGRLLWAIHRSGDLVSRKTKPD